VTPGIPACLSGFSAWRMTMSFMQSPAKHLLSLWMSSRLLYYCITAT
jgi:hypothetical protein